MVISDQELLKIEEMLTDFLLELEPVIWSSYLILASSHPKMPVKALSSKALTDIMVSF
jgi:hypothetical protein